MTDLTTAPTADTFMTLSRVTRRLEHELGMLVAVTTTPGGDTRLEAGVRRFGVLLVCVANAAGAEYQITDGTHSFTTEDPAQLPVFLKVYGRRFAAATDLIEQVRDASRAHSTVERAVDWAML